MKKPNKFKSSEEKRRYEENVRSWQMIVDKHKPKKALPNVDRKDSYSLSVPVGREQPHIPSRGNGIGVATVRPTIKYTGDKIKGLGTMHKSNMVPVFSEEQAKDIARMRR